MDAGAVQVAEALGNDQLQPRPTASASVYPNSMVAAVFQLRIRPWSSAEMIASIADSMTDRNFASDSRRAIRSFDTVTCRSMRASTSRASTDQTMDSDRPERPTRLEDRRQGPTGGHGPRR